MWYTKQELLEEVKAFLFLYPLQGDADPVLQFYSQKPTSHWQTWRCSKLLPFQLLPEEV